MLNQRPIFINGFSSGGTTILMNAFASHPKVCTVYEVHHLFKGYSLTDSPLRVLLKCILNDVPAMALTRQDFFRPRLIQPRKPLSSRAKWFIDRILYKEKMRSRNVFFNRYKNQNVEYTRNEIANSRLIGKNVDGMIYATDALSEMYPDATFIGLVRNGLALCESHLRKNRPPNEIGYRYRVLVEKMLADAERLPHYQILRFEDLMADPVGIIKKIYAHADLEFNQLGDVRMQIRRVLDQDGQHQLNGGVEWHVVWFELDKLTQYFQRDVNRNQIQRLSAHDRTTFLKEAGGAMEQLGYSTSDPDQNDQPKTNIYSFSHPTKIPLRNVG